MPRTLFDQEHVPHTRNHKRGGTVLFSVLLHALIVAALVALQFGNALDAVSISRPVIFAMATPTLPEPPAAVRPKPPVAVETTLIATAAPIAAADNPADNEPPQPVSIGPTAPGGIPGVGKPGGLPFGPPPGIGVPSPPPPVQRPAGPIPVGGDIKAPERLVYTKPIYPTIAQTAKVEGTVILEATIDETGVVKNVRVLRSIALLDQAATDAVSRWRYTPTRLNGVAVPVTMTVTVTFTLR
jgi:periplasmic protein TonB